MKKTIIFLLIASFVGIELSGCKSSRRASEKETNTKEVVNKDQRIKDKYAALVGVKPSAIVNMKLYRFIDAWYSTPYQFGGTSTSGVDCSGFVQSLYREVYSKSVPRTTADLKNATKNVSKSKLAEGNLVFFSINSKKNSHVGIYLDNGKFVHASSSKGVIISDLNNPYYLKVFNRGGVIQ
ncbi:MAG TPA: glycoside hydrolase [Flavobacteriales bacterium]|nr:C40 family peptidase [Flavobacteriales bacterium]HAW18852.1 glycoside hydrolase [Flavobacteriales bacterium]